MPTIALVTFKRLLFSCSLFCLSIAAIAQPGNKNQPDSALTLDQCVTYALKHQPNINQALINVAITRVTNAINLATWLPQANVSANFTHYLTLPTAFIRNSATPGGAPIEQKTGVVNTISPLFTVTQTIFNPALIYAGKSAPLYVKQAE